MEFLKNLPISENFYYEWKMTLVLTPPTSHEIEISIHFLSFLL